MMGGPGHVGGIVFLDAVQSFDPECRRKQEKPAVSIVIGQRHQLVGGCGTYRTFRCDIIPTIARPVQG